MNFFILFLCLLTQSALACWRIQGELVSGKDVLKINQIVNHDQTYTLGAGNIILNFKIPSSKDKMIFNYEVVQKNNRRLEKITKKQIQLIVDQPETITFTTLSPSELKFVLKEI